MVKIIMHGCNGHMGQVISNIVEKDANAQIVAGIDIADQGKNSYPVFTNIDDCQVEADAVIDFSSPKAFDKLMDYCEKKNMPVVLCTTGLSEEQLARVEESAKKDRRSEICQHVPWNQHSSEAGSGCCQSSGNSRL